MRGCHGRLRGTGLSGPPRVAIHYRRPPDRLRIYEQRVVEERDDVIVTLSEPMGIVEPMIVDETVLLEPGSLAVWFTFPGAWHDIGRFHRADGTFSGLYANVLTPPVIDGSVWHTTDLYLDVWWPDGGDVRLLDEDEFEAAVTEGLVTPDVAARATAEAENILSLATSERWPPAIVDEWTLSRALERLGSA